MLAESMDTDTGYPLYPENCGKWNTFVHQMNEADSFNVMRNCYRYRDERELW